MVDGPGKMKQNTHRSDGLEIVEGDIRMDTLTLHLSLTKGHGEKTRERKSRRRGRR
jgi:hypothetical protein